MLSVNMRVDDQVIDLFADIEIKRICGIVNVHSLSDWSKA